MAVRHLQCRTTDKLDFIIRAEDMAGIEDLTPENSSVKHSFLLPLSIGGGLDNFI